MRSLLWCISTPISAFIIKSILKSSMYLHRFDGDSYVARSVYSHRPTKTDSSTIWQETMFHSKLHERLAAYEFVLCSSSPRRYELLQQVGITPRVEKSAFKEDLDKSLYEGDPYRYVSDTSFEKCQEVYSRLRRRNCDTSNREANNDGHCKPLLLLSADTVITAKGEIFEKPGSYASNVAMLKTLRDHEEQGTKIEVVSGCTILKEDPSTSTGNVQVRRFLSTTEIHLVKGLTDETIEEYCTSGEGQSVAGGFKIQGAGCLLFDSISGDYYNCVGLPLSLVCRELGALV